MGDNEYLAHHGILGMKWGCRRYQNKDGSLTPAGQKRAAKMHADYAELTGKQLRVHPESTKSSDGKNKGSEKEDSKSDSSADLAKKTQELKAQREYLSVKKDVLDLQKKITDLTPQKVSKGKEFVAKFGPTVAKTLWNDVGKNNINKAIEKQFDLGKKESESDRLARLAKDWRNRRGVAETTDWFEEREKERRGQNRNLAG